VQVFASSGFSTEKDCVITTLLANCETAFLLPAADLYQGKRSVDRSSILWPRGHHFMTRKFFKFPAEVHTAGASTHLLLCSRRLTLGPDAMHDNWRTQKSNLTQAPTAIWRITKWSIYIVCKHGSNIPVLCHSPGLGR
jgi:hypothetical protein